MSVPTPTKDRLPQYVEELRAFHRAHWPELRRIIEDLRLNRNSTVLDVACGDGVYSKWISELLGPDGLVVGTDISTAYLNLAKQGKSRCNWLAGAADTLPFPDDCFDLVWCAQSLSSLPEPVAVLRELFRVLRPGGRVVILENDSVHELILSWPVDLELAIRRAQWRAYAVSKQHPGKRYMGRRLSSFLRGVGFTNVSRKTYATDRVPPLSSDECSFLIGHLAELRKTVEPYLAARHKCRFDRLLQSDSPRFLLAQPDFEMTWLDVVCIGHKP
jgi:ubiquinone/menaquinone biosynthesis C-methylase UbiE